MAESSDWVKRHADANRNERQNLEALIRAGQPLISAIHEQMKADIEAFCEEFPTERVELFMDERKQLVRATRQFGTLTIRSCAYLNPMNASIILKFTPSEIDNAQIKLNREQGILSLERHSIPMVAQKLLMQILFPGHASDPAVKCLFYDEFRPKEI